MRRRRQPIRMFPVFRRRSGPEWTFLISSFHIRRVSCPKVLVVMGPWVFRLRSAGTPHGNLRCSAI